MSTIERDRTEMHTQGSGRSMGERIQQGFDRPHRGETTPFFWTSEFLSMLAGVTAVAICTAVFDNLDVRMGLILITGILGAYILSRGIAKAGTPYRTHRGWTEAGSDR